MKEEDQIPRYIRDNRDLYTRDAIEQMLANAGHSPEKIAAGWRAVEEEDREQAARAPRRVNTGGWGCLVSAWIVALLTGIVFLYLTNARLTYTPYYSMLAVHVPPEARPLVDAALAGVNIGTMIVGLGLLAATIWLLRRGRPVENVTVLVLVVAFVWYMIVLGTCIYSPQISVR